MTMLSIDVSGKNFVFLTSKVVVLGRSVDSDVVLDDKTVSRIHGEVRFNPDTSTWIYTDKNSGNGTFHNDQLISTLELKLPTILKLGNSENPQLVKFSAVSDTQNTPGEVSISALIEKIPSLDAEPNQVILPPDEDSRDLLEAPRAQNNDDVVNCGYCSGAINREFGPRCPACETYIHAECWSEFEGCIAYGCSENPDMKNYQGAR